MRVRLRKYADRYDEVCAHEANCRNKPGVKAGSGHSCDEACADVDFDAFGNDIDEVDCVFDDEDQQPDPD